MNEQVMNTLGELMDDARLGKIQALVYVAVTDDGDAEYGHTDLTEDEIDTVNMVIYDLVAELQPDLDS